MSSICRVLMGLPFEKGTSARMKQVGDIIYTRAKMPNGTTETSIIKCTKDGRKLLKSVVIDGDWVEIYRPQITDLKFNKKTGRRIDFMS